MSSPVVVRVPAKVNLWLSVGGPQDDGYHDLATVFHAISLYDEITAELADTVEVTVEGRHADRVPDGLDNIAARAAHLLATTMGVTEGARLRIRKQIPVAGGLAGGSADAAGALVACDALWDLGLTRDDLAGFAARLGSDVPFSLLGGTAIGTGRGEVLTPALSRGDHHWVVAVSDVGLSTPVVYAELDRLRADAVLPEPFVPERIMKALMSGSPEELGGALGNDMQVAALTLAPGLAPMLRLGEEHGALAGLVSGSGPSLVFLARGPGHAEELVAVLRDVGHASEVLHAHGPVPGARVVEPVRV